MTRSKIAFFNKARNIRFNISTRAYLFSRSERRILPMRNHLESYMESFL